MRWLLLFGTLALAGSAQAQTQCYPNNPSYPAAGMTCQDNTPPPIQQPQYIQAMPDRRTIEEQCAGIHIDLTGVCRRNREAKARRALEAQDVATLVINGDCDGAIKRALLDQDFDMAQKAKGLCTPRASK